MWHSAIDSTLRVRRAVIMVTDDLLDQIGYLRLNNFNELKEQLGLPQDVIIMNHWHSFEYAAYCVQICHEKLSRIPEGSITSAIQPVINQDASGSIILEWPLFN